MTERENMKVEKLADAKMSSGYSLQEEMLAAAEAGAGALSVVDARKIIKATSSKPQAASAIKKPQMIFKTILEFEKNES